MKYGYTPSSTFYSLYPVKVLESALLFMEEDIRPVPLYENTTGDWGDHSPVEEDGTTYPMPGGIWLRWWSVPEQKCYDTELFLNPKRSEKLWKELSEGRETESYKYFVFGMSPYGGVAVWMKTQKKAVLLEWFYANNDELHNYESIILKKRGLITHPSVLPPKDFFDRNMQRFTYRYVALEDFWDGDAWQPFDDDSDEMFCDHVEELLYDGTRDQLGSEYLFDYHQAGMPKSLAVVWYTDKDEYKAYFWIKNAEVMNVFQKVYYNKPDAKADFIIRFDLQAKTYELGLKREDMNLPIVLPQDSYEVLVLRNNNKCYKSNNYSLPWDAWRW